MIDKRSVIQFPLTPKADWCLGLIIRVITRSGCHKLKLSKKKKSHHYNSISTVGKKKITLLALL